MSETSFFDKIFCSIPESESVKNLFGKVFAEYLNASNLERTGRVCEIISTILAKTTRLVLNDVTF